eukprot:jgi/Botrbrau1/8620/Bobra.0196s0017.1
MVDTFTRPTEGLQSLKQAQEEALQLKLDVERQQADILRQPVFHMRPPVPGIPVSQDLDVTEAGQQVEEVVEVELLEEEEQEEQEEVEEEVVLLSDSEDEEKEAAARYQRRPVGRSQQDSSLEESLKSMSVSEERVAGRQFTKQERGLIQGALRGPPSEDILVTHRRSGIDMTRRLIQCLCPGQWLNDEVMNMYMGLLQERDNRRRAKGEKPFCHFFNTFFVCKLYQDTDEYNFEGVKGWTRAKKLKLAGQASTCVLDVDRIMVPVHLPGHWVSAVIDMAHQCVIYLDSMGGRERGIPNALLRWVADEHRDKRGIDLDVSQWSIEYKTVPTQRNGYDCGVFALQFLEHESRAAPLHFAQNDMPYYRMRIALDLLQGTVPDNPP